MHGVEDTVGLLLAQVHSGGVAVDQAKRCVQLGHDGRSDDLHRKQVRQVLVDLRHVRGRDAEQAEVAQDVLD